MTEIFEQMLKDFQTFVTCAEDLIQEIKEPIQDSDEETQTKGE